jgi:hypothetical protein
LKGLEQYRIDFGDLVGSTLGDDVGEMLAELAVSVWGKIGE